MEAEQPAAAAMSLALGCDLILDAILARLDSPFDLASAAVVCKRWKIHARLDDVLASFRERQALRPRPRPLGFYVRFRRLDSDSYRTRFVAMSQHRADLTDVVRRGSFGFGYQNHVDSGSEYDVDILYGTDEDSGGDSGPSNASNGDADAKADDAEGDSDAGTDGDSDDVDDTDDEVDDDGEDPDDVDENGEDPDDVDEDGENPADGSDDNPHMDEGSLVLDCRNGRVLILQDMYDGLMGGNIGTFVLRRPLERDRILDILAPLQLFFHKRDFAFLPDDGGDAATCSVLEVTLSNNISTPAALLRLLVLQANRWADHFSVAPDYPEPSGPWIHRLRVRDNLYMLSCNGDLLCFDVSNLGSMRVSAIDLPPAVFVTFTDSGYKAQMLARADGSGLYFLQVTGLELDVWLRRTEGGGEGNWVLEQSIPLLQAFGDIADLLMEGQMSCGDFISIFGAGDNAEFVFLVADRQRHIFYLNIKTRKVEVVYERCCNDGKVVAIHPFMMI